MEKYSKENVLENFERETNFVKQEYINSIKELNMFISNIIDKNEFDKIEDILKLWEAKNRVLNHILELNSSKVYRLGSNDYTSPSVNDTPCACNESNITEDKDDDLNLENISGMGGLDTVLMIIRKALEEP